ncbi:MAG: acyl-CoA-binding protein [Bacteroidota bacterium]|nr:acyl-CoA-binding protein [Bacteroidota bacterium]
MTLDELFQEATVKSKQLPNQSNENLLTLYSLFKQASEGDVNVPKPENFFDMVGIAKWNAWNELKGMSKDEAKQKYIDAVKAFA